MLDIRTSQQVLRRKITEWLSDLDDRDWLIYESFRKYELDDLKRAKKIILFGDFVCAYLQLKQLGIKNKEVWVLCNKAKWLLEALDLKDIGQIKVVDRYLLFPLSESQSVMKDFSKDEISLVYGGRISRAKNIKFLIYLTNYLQEVNAKVSLRIYGEFDDFPNVASTGYKVQGSYRGEVEGLIQKLDWVTSPVLTHNLDENEWLDHVTADDLCINLSTYWSDDFSVALAQSQSKGLGIIASDIGGHSDLKGNNLIHIPAHLIVNEIGVNDDESIQVQAQRLAELLLVGIPKSSELEAPLARNLPAVDPKLISIDRAFDYAQTPSGREFIFQYEQVWRHSRHVSEEVLFLKSSEQNHWNSLVRISKQVELTWLSTQDLERKIFSIDVDQGLLKYHVSKLFNIKVVVAQALGEKTINILKTLRTKMGLKFKLFSYPHELPSVLYSGLKLRGLEDFFLTSDTFINHCSSDIELTGKSFENAHAIYLPAGFCSRNESEIYAPNNFQLCYVGRISEQKNLHTLFWSLSLIAQRLRKEGGKLHIYGHHDHFGAPNFGITGHAYIDELGHLASKLKIEDLIVFHGHVNISDWREFLIRNQYVGVFPGFHCDENFGYAPFDFLQNGLPTVLTNWGGFRELIKGFENSFSVDVFQGEMGPFVNPAEFASAILKACSTKKSSKKQDLRTWQIQKWKEVINKNISPAEVSNEKLRFSSQAKVLLGELKASVWPGVKARGWMLNGQMFNGYGDKRYNDIAQSYGAIQPSLGDSSSQADLLAPWVESDGAHFKVQDPLKGSFVVDETTKLVKLGLLFHSSVKS